MTVEDYDNLLYATKFKENKNILDEIKNNKELLLEASDIKRNKWDNGDTVKGISICDYILNNYKTIDKDVYNKLINIIYSNKDISRIVVDGASNGGYSYLLMSLWNDDLKLNEEQKMFVVDEAMNKMGTTRFKKQCDDYSELLELNNVTDDINSLINIDGSVNLVGAKALKEYINYLYSTLSVTQAHGDGIYDVRYFILRNDNWTEKEKEKLVMDFYSENELYEECLEQWEWQIINDSLNDDKILDFNELMYYTYDDIKEIYINEEEAKQVWKEINFCKLMHKLRPQEWEKEFIKKI